MSRFSRLVYQLKKDIEINPFVCGVCGKVETPDDIFLRYGNGKIMCDDCAYEYYKDEPIE